ncbi:hypothetical protein M0R04_10345 [Candidatus Dojkabacteria bacterium]|jgi:hypothetical protein|nr:hypothetical protein [Candidatus Dojkabacteria bacterium]
MNTQSLNKELDNIQRSIWALVSQDLRDRGVKMTIGDAYSAGQSIKLVLHSKVKRLLESTISQTRQEVIEEIKKMDSAVTIQGSLGSKIDVEEFDLIFRKDLLNKLSNKEK